jgi:NADH-quinone oxidoreductase subunit M
VVFGAVYMLWMFQRVMFGPVTDPHNEALKDLNYREVALMAPLIGAIFFMGIYPNFFFSKLSPSIDRMIARSTNKVSFQGQSGVATSAPTHLTAAAPVVAMGN